MERRARAGMGLLSGWQGRGWSAESWQQSSWQPQGPADSTEWGRDVLPQILPAFVQGWFLFIDSGLDTLERNVLHAELKGEFDVRAVEAALRKHWADADVRRRDQEKWRHFANLADEEEAMAGEIDYDLLEAEGYSMEEVEILAAEQERVEEGLALIQEGMKMSRQFYKVPPPPSPLPSSGFRRDPLRPRPGDGKGGIKCLRCGGPHKVAVCPEKSKGEVPGSASKALANVAEEEAAFTFFAAEALSTTGVVCLHHHEGCGGARKGCDRLRRHSHGRVDLCLGAPHGGEHPQVRAEQRGGRELLGEADLQLWQQLEEPVCQHGIDVRPSARPNRDCEDSCLGCRDEPGVAECTVFAAVRSLDRLRSRFSSFPECSSRLRHQAGAH